MNLLVTGAGGLIGSAVSRHASRIGWRPIAVRRLGGAAPGAETAGAPVWDVAAGRLDLRGAGPIDAVIHLAGETIAQRWSAAAKRRIRDSRIEGTKSLVNAVRQWPSPPRVFLCASATGFYGKRGDAWVDERDEAGSGFLAEICREWEAAARGMAGICRVVHLRFGVVLAREGGALAKIRPVFRLGLGGRVGSGRQYWSWITLGDLARVIEHVIRHDELSGPINVTSPSPVTNAELTRTLARVLRRPAIVPVPAFVVRAVFGEMGRDVLLSGVRVRPTELMNSGFRFDDPDLEGALRRVAA